MEDATLKHCPICDNDYPATVGYFNRTAHHKDGLHSYCRTCSNELRAKRERDKKKNAELNRTVSTDEISKNGVNQQNISAPTEHIIGSPDECGSCGTKTGNIFGDVDDKTQEKYGYLCNKCYKLAKVAQSDTKRMQNVLTYLEVSRHHRVQ